MDNTNINMRIKIDNNEQDITYFDKINNEIAYNDLIIKLYNQDNLEDAGNIISKIIGQSYNLNISEINALNIILRNNNIKVNKLKEVYCNQNKVSNSTATRAIAVLIEKGIIYINKENEIILNESFKIKDKEIKEVEYIVIKVNNNYDNKVSL